jgi:N6-adenosine-specific RNA methylase IME4
VILSDPAWAFRNYTDSKNGAAVAHYDVMSTEEICQLPVAESAAKNCALCLWVPYAKLPDGLEVVARWGFDFKTVLFSWTKTYANGNPYMGLGWYTRAGSEICLLGVKGSMKVESRCVLSTIIAPRRKHSQKPDEQYERIEKLWPGRRYLEMFARSRRPGWDCWGKEAPVSEENLCC